MPSSGPAGHDTEQGGPGRTTLALLLAGLEEIDAASADRPPVRAAVLRLKDLAQRLAAPDRPAGTGSLSGREMEVLRLAAGGHSTKAIALSLGLGPKSVETYKERAMDKMALRDRVALVRFAALCGWLA